MKVHVADRVDHADRAVAEQDGPAFQIKIAQGEKRGIRGGVSPARRRAAILRRKTTHCRDR